MKENLYCPRCSKPFSGETIYCRTCGLSLDGVSEIVSGDALNAPETVSGPNPKMIRFGIALFLFGTILGLINAVMRDFNLFPEIYGKVVFLTVVILGLSSIGASMLFPVTKYKKRIRSRALSDLQNPLDTAPLHGQLASANPADFDSSFSSYSREPIISQPASIVEHTTRQLEQRRGSNDRPD